MVTREQSEYVSREVARFVQHLRAENRSNETIIMYSRILRGFLMSVGKTATKMTKDDCNRWKVREQNTPNLKTGKPRSSNGMIPRVAAVNTWLEKVVDRKDLMMDYPKWVPPVIRILTLEEQQRFIDAAKAPMANEKGHRSFEFCYRDHAVICLMQYAGLRASEACDLMVEDVNLAKGIIHVRRGKGGKPRDAAIGPPGTPGNEALRLYIMRSLPQIRAAPGLEGRLFFTEGGQALTRKHLWYLCRRIALRAGIDPKRVHPHLLRHHCGTNLMRIGANPHEIKTVLGHASVEMQDMYVHVSVEDMAQAQARLFERAPAQPTMPGPCRDHGYHAQPMPDDIMRLAKALMGVMQRDSPDISYR